MNIINSRQAAILKYLLNHPDPVSSMMLGKTVGISARIVRQNIPPINSWLNRYQAEIRSKPNYGLILVCSSDEKKQITDAINQEETSRVFSLKDRELLILFEILSQAGDFSENRARNILNVSRTTMAHDINRVEKWLNNCDLFLTRRPRIGVAVQGRENDIRHALISLLFEIALETDLINMALWGTRGSGQKQNELPQAAELILDRMADWGLNDGWNFMTWVENELAATFADGDHLALTLYWVIMSQRMKKGHFIQISDERIHYLSTRPEYKIVQDILVRLIKKTNIELPSPEIAQLTLEVMTAKGTFTQSGETPEDSNAERKTFIIAKILVQKIGQYLGADLNNSEVVSRLADHLSRVVIRMKFGLPIQNSLKEETRQAYPLLWQATSKAIDEVWDEAGPPLPAEEIAYITMYVALALELNRNVSRVLAKPRVVVACPSGGVTVWMLVSRLRAELPDIEIKEVISLREINRLDPEEIDAIISSTVVNSRKIKTITVNPLLSEQNVQKIKHELEYYTTKSESQK
ncbi:MAG: transcription antiterminator [Anaerolineaceae bacterium]